MDKYSPSDALLIQNQLDETFCKGFDVKVAAAGDYFRLELHGLLISGDSANSDLYSIDSAFASFSAIFEDCNFVNRWIRVVSYAIEMGFYFRAGTNIDDIFINAEKFIIDKTPFEERCFEIITDFWDNISGNAQSLTFYDEEHECCCAEYGQIIANDYKQRSYFRVIDNKLVPAKWFDANEQDVYTYLDTIVTTKGKVITLIA